MNAKTKTVAISSILTVIFYVFVIWAAGSCEQTKQPSTQAEQQMWEYKVTHFSREDYMDMNERLEELGDEGWEYAGPLTNDGINSQFVVFKREKRTASNTQAD